MPVTTANKSPWQIGAAHWDQRDLYTQNARTDAGGYGLGPPVHPADGSYAYAPRRAEPDPHDEDPAHVAWPMLRLRPTDAEIHRAVRLALDVRSGLDARDIDVAVKDAEVTLRGEVPNAVQKKRAEELAGACHGVFAVANHLRIRSEAPPLNPLALVIPWRQLG
jgi:hypothetical protein